MNFRPELAAAVMAGTKTVTRRLTSPNPRSPWYEGACSLQVGKDYAVCPGRGRNAIGRVVITSVRLETLGLGHCVRTDIAREEGFTAPEEFVAAWEAINGTLTIGAQVWRVGFGSPQPPRS